METEFDVQVIDTCFDPNQPPSAGTKPKVYFKVMGGKPLYKVWLYLTGRDLPYVESVTYKLHPELYPPERTVRRELTNPNCQYIVWTPGFFPIHTIIRDKSGRVYEANHEMMYGKELDPKLAKFERVEDEARFTRTQ
jgi:hypothetical protein